MNAYKLKSALKDYIWGGRKLFSYGFSSDKDKIAEAWVLSFHKDGMSELSDGTPIDKAFTRADWGVNAEKFKDFPVLVKFIDSADNLSVQVHPSDEYALKCENSFGKTEVWHVLECENGAGLYVGFKRDITKAEFSAGAGDGCILSLMNFFKVKKGESYFIPAGTDHAIRKGCTVCEVQQNSNITYRVYDYDRIGADGKPRQLHTEKAAEVADLKKYKPIEFGYPIIADCEYFCAKVGSAGKIYGRNDSFTGIIVTGGEGFVDGIPAKKGDGFFIPAGKSAQVDGNIEFIEVYVG